ncbi:hypothetical protein LI036_10790 [bacterium 210917-DFI.7.65]|nr:hypothetical protein [bacterium 210917-DFI.7.65]
MILCWIQNGAGKERDHVFGKWPQKAVLALGPAIGSVLCGPLVARWTLRRLGKK